MRRWRKGDVVLTIGQSLRSISLMMTIVIGFEGGRLGLQ